MHKCGMHNIFEYTCMTTNGALHRYALPSFTQHVSVRIIGNQNKVYTTSRLQCTIFEWHRMGKGLRSPMEVPFTKSWIQVWYSNSLLLDHQLVLYKTCIGHIVSNDNVKRGVFFSKQAQWLKIIQLLCGMKTSGSKMSR